MKPQLVRLLDVFVIGPLMVAGAAALYRRHPVAGVALGVFGIATVLYNGRNFVVAERDGLRC